ncbi:MAG: hypothetical protein QNJ34_10245 [Xenococcaceae cyanobacterium MO_188.B29]|nr:hypothetical protein [Xenococcaceae cyanobacterium MO_188.B29]
MEFIVFWIVVVGITGFFYYPYYLYQRRQRKIEYIKRSQVVTINNDELIQDDFILYNYGIPLEIKNSGIVEVVLPTLDSEGQLMYHYSFHYLSGLSIPKFKINQRKEELRAAQQLGYYIKEHFQIERDITALKEQDKRINDLAKLVLKSDIYSNQIEKYNKALIEIRKLIKKAEQLERLYINLVREGLIGIKISSYNTEDITNNLLIHNIKYERLREEYQYMKDVATAYGSIMRQF